MRSDKNWHGDVLAELANNLSPESTNTYTEKDRRTS